MTEAEARQKVIDWADGFLRPDGDRAAIVDEVTIRKSYGWVFFYQSQRYLETGTFSYALAGNGPVVVMASDGRLHPLGTAQPIEDEIADFERRNGLASSPTRQR